MHPAARSRRRIVRPGAQARSRGSVGTTRRPLGTGGPGRQNLNEGQWASSRYLGYNSSQLPPIDRPPVGEQAVATLLQDVGAGVDCEPTQYTISVLAAELVILDPSAGTPIPARSIVAGQGPGVSELQVRLEWGTGATFNNRMDLDIGAGFSMSLTAQTVQASVIVPNGFVDLDAQAGQDIVAGPLDPVTGQPGSFHAALVYGTAIRDDGAYTMQEWQLTRALFVPLNTTVRVAIPPGVDFVEANEISLPAGGTPFLNFQTGAQQAGVFLDVGQWSVSTTPRSFERTRLPGNARFISSGAVVPGSNRLFLLRFTSRP